MSKCCKEAFGAASLENDEAMTAGKGCNWCIWEIFTF